MTASKIAITIDDNTLKQLDGLVKSRLFPSRSRAIQDAVKEKIARIEKRRLARECAKLDHEFEQSFAEKDSSVPWERIHFVDDFFIWRTPFRCIYCAFRNGRLSDSSGKRYNSISSTQTTYQTKYTIALRRIICLCLY